MTFWLIATWLMTWQQPAFRVDASYIKVPVTVLDESGRSLLGLTRQDFRLWDEGELRAIANFVLDQNPINVALLVDSSGSLQEELEQLKQASYEFARTFGREDRIAVLSFSDRVHLLQNWTNDRRSIRRALKKVKRGYRTALFDALTTTARERLGKVAGKRVIILLTDGLDNESSTSYDSVMQDLIRSNTALYVVSRTRLVESKVSQSNRVEFLNRVMKNLLDDGKNFVDIYFRAKEQSMNYLAETSGGRVLYPERLKDLGDSYLQIARELKSQYVLTFLAPQQSQREFRTIEVECLQPVARILHRERYRVP